MKAKIKLRLRDREYLTNLEMLIKLDGDFSYKYKKTLISSDEFYDNDFYNEVYKFATNKEKIIEKGEEFLKEILNSELSERGIEEVKKMIKNFEPIEIEVKDAIDSKQSI